MANEYKAAPKQAIDPISFAIEVTAERISQTGTFSGIKIKSVKAIGNAELSKYLKLTIPPRAGGGMLVQVTELEALKHLKAKGEVSSEAKPKLKLW